MAVDVEYDEDDRIFVPPIVELVDFQLPGKLSASYADVREAVRKTHESVYEMWGAVFEFAIVCKENEDDLNRFCEQQGIGARDKTSEFTRAVKIAISTPAITKSDDELKFDKAQVSQFCHIFDLAVERDNVQTGPEFVDSR